ncbi:hypothetical protein [uncultured Enterococcus sp.]|uniref:hypothetical protein n=1 Tax=uncultured Enterococcus sp. TaxID=167972 RepID=UPI0025942F7F|nr:hypothetical protein [uncultured Enterococcus sp.]
MRYDTIRPIYYLKKWQYFEAARYELSSIELENAKIFFHAMRKLKDSDRLILMDVYYYSKEPCAFDNRTGYYRSLYPVKDSVLAEKYGVTVDKFGQMKCRAQDQLKKAMQVVLEQMGNHFVFRMNNLYLVEILQQGTYKERYVLGREHDAKVFQPSESITVKLLLQGFEKVPVAEREI